MAAKKAAPKKPVTDMAHPSHPIWEILLKALTLATAVGPGIVGLAYPENADLANKVGAIATAAEAQIPGSK